MVRLLNDRTKSENELNTIIESNKTEVQNDSSFLVTDYKPILISNISLNNDFDIPLSILKEMVENNSKNKNSEVRKFNNSILGFDTYNHSNWYSMSYPIYNKDSTYVYIEISDLCSGLCGSGKSIIYHKNKKGLWKEEVLGAWLH